MAGSDRIAMRAVIRGRVQGVGYRAWTASEAARQGLDGWVRNRSDGTVEALFAGPAGVVRDMLIHCRQGPRLAVISEIVTEDAEPPPQTGFRTLPTL